MIISYVQWNKSVRLNSFYLKDASMVKPSGVKEGVHGVLLPSCDLRSAQSPSSKKILEITAQKNH